MTFAAGSIALPSDLQALINQRLLPSGVGSQLQFADALAASETSGAFIVADLHLLRSEGAALNGTTDDLPAVQRILNNAAARTATSLSIPVVLFLIPAGAPLFLSAPPQSGACHCFIRGLGEHASYILMKSGGAGAWQHGSAATPALGYFGMDGVTVRDLNPGGSGVAGITLQFAPGAPQSALRITNVAFDQWTTAWALSNIPRGAHLSHCYLTGPNQPAYPMQKGAGIEIAATSTFSGGSFSFLFDDIEISNYTWGFRFAIASALEGVIIRSCRAYNGWGLVTANCTVANYKSLLWSIKDCDYEGLGPLIDATNLRVGCIENCYLITDPNTASAANPTSYPTRPLYMIFNGCEDWMVRANEIEVGTTASASTALIYTDPNCVRMRFRDNTIKSFSTIYAGYIFDKNTVSNTIEERGTVWTLWTGGIRVVDTGGNQYSESQVTVSYAGNVLGGGVYQVRGTTATLTVGSDGFLTVSYPTRFDGQALFIGGAPVPLWDVANSNAQIGQPSLHAAMSTGFVLNFGTSASGVQVQIPYVATGL